MFAKTRIAWSEFRVGFSPKSTGVPGARDFVSLAVFFMLMMFLVLLGWSVRDGLWGRIEQVLLGALPNGQPPIRLSYHIDNKIKIDTNILAGFAERFASLAIVPQRFADGASGALILPGLATQSGSEPSPMSGDNGHAKSVQIRPASSRQTTAGQLISWDVGLKDKRKTDFRIEALPLGSPLWRWIIASSATDPADLGDNSASGDNTKTATPLVVAASRHLFREHFRYQQYRSTILHNSLVPCELKRLLPEQLPAGRIDQLRYLVLEVKENFVSDRRQQSTSGPSYQAFRIVWVDSFPTPAATAIVAPLSIYEMLLAATELPTLEIRAEMLQANAGPRIAQVRLADTDIEKKGIAEFHKLARCLGAVPVQGSTGETASDAESGNICSPPSSRFAAPSQALKARTVTGQKSAKDIGSIGTCELLRQRIHLKYPRVLDNEQDLLICTDGYRQLRASEVSSCAMSAGLQGLAHGAKLFDGRLELIAARPPMPVRWLGPSRIEMPCGALRPGDLERARQHAGERKKLRRTGSFPQPAADADTGWIKKCEAYRDAAGPDVSGGGPAAVFYLDGYQDVTVYPSNRRTSKVSLRDIGGQLASYARELAANPAKLSNFSAHASQLKRIVDPALAPERIALNTVTKTLLDWETEIGRQNDTGTAPVFRLDPAYESALIRFGVLSLIIDEVSTPLALGTLTLYVFLTAIILATAIDHRRRQYGLLLMSGVRPGAIGYIVALQIVLTCIVGGVLGYSVFIATASAINVLLSDSSVVAEARQLIGLDIPSFLPSLAWPTVLGLWTGMVLIAMIVGTLILRFQRITTALAPINLVKS